MRFHLLSTIVLCLFITESLNWGQTTAVEKGLQAITDNAIKAQLGFLSSDWMEGREAGEKGEFIAADYIASMLLLYGIKPGGDYLSESGSEKNGERNERSYFQNFRLLKTVPGDEPIMKIKSSNNRVVKSANLAYNVDFTFQTAVQSVEIEAPVVFTGYGYIDDTLEYNDFNNLDVKDKYILKIAGFPKFVMKTLDKEKTAALINKMDLMYEAMGIIGILEFDTDDPYVGKPDMKDFMKISPAEGVVRREKPYARFSLPGKKYHDNLIKIQVSVRTANEILDGTGITLDDYTSKKDKNEKFTIPEFKGKSIYFKSTVKTSQVAVRNILGIIEGRNPDKFIVLGAHYDHIGFGNGYLWNGADDNGSGIAGVLTIAKAIMAAGEKPENSIWFAFWTAEEEGLLGSRYFVRNSGFPIANLKLNMNFDMISRYISDDEPKKVTMIYTSSFPWFRDMTANNLNKYGIDLIVDYQPSANPPGGSDHRSFVEMGLPIIRFKPGHREEYHTPMDETGTIDWDIMEKIIKIGFADTWDLANAKW